MLFRSGNTSERLGKEVRKNVEQQIALLNEKDSAPKLIKLMFEKGGRPLASFVEYMASMLLPALGLGFARVAGNLFNMSLSFIPGIGAFRVMETHPSSQKLAHYNMVMRHQIIGMIGMVAIYSLLKSIEDEPDDEKRGWGWEGSWDGLTPQQKALNYSTGRDPNTVWWIDKKGKRHSLKYVNWPIASLMSMMGYMSDTIRYRPDDWKNSSPASKFARGIYAMGESVTNTSVLSQLMDNLGTSRSSEDPFEASMRRIPRMVGGFFGGYIPRAIKDADMWFNPKVNNYKGNEALAAEVPFLRRYFGNEKVDIFGKQVEISKAPWSRIYKGGPEAAEYKLLDRLMNHGIILSPANPKNRLVGRGSNKRHMTEEEGRKYEKLVGQGYRKMVLSRGPRLLAMRQKSAEKLARKLSDQIRDRAEIQAIRK